LEPSSDKKDLANQGRIAGWNDKVADDGNSGFFSSDEEEFPLGQEYEEHMTDLEELKNEIENEKVTIKHFKKLLAENNEMCNNDVCNKEIEAAEEKLKELNAQLIKYNASPKGGNKHKKTMKKKGKKKGKASKKGKKKSKKVRKKRKKTMKKKKKGKKKKKKGKSKKARK
jgi:hypothetical protein